MYCWAPGRSFGGNLARHFAGRKGGLYCVLQCEGQTKHTAMVSGSRPAWKQELSFKSVQISSDLQVLPYPQTAERCQTPAMAKYSSCLTVLCQSYSASSTVHAHVPSNVVCFPPTSQMI